MKTQILHSLHRNNDFLIPSPFTKLMYNFFHDEYNSDPFYIEDAELISRFQAYVDKISKNVY